MSETTTTIEDILSTLEREHREIERLRAVAAADARLMAQVIQRRAKRKERMARYQCASYQDRDRKKAG
jgi:hypothetical protein